MCVSIHASVCACGCILCKHKKRQGENPRQFIFSVEESEQWPVWQTFPGLIEGSVLCVSGVPWQQLRPLYIINSQGFCVASAIIPGKGSVSILCPYLSFPGRGVRDLVCVRVCVLVRECVRLRSVCLWVHVREQYSHTCDRAKCVSCAQ